MAKKLNLKKAVAYANYVLDICLAHECGCMEAKMIVVLDTFMGEPESHRQNIRAIGGTAEEFCAGCDMVAAIESSRNGDFGQFGRISAEWASNGTVDLHYEGFRVEVAS